MLYKFLIGVILLTALVAVAVLSSKPEEIYTAPAPVAPSCDTFECIVILRTQQNFERDYLQYMEQARLSALQELNKEAQDMVYVSPYTETPSSN